MENKEMPVDIQSRGWVFTINNPKQTEQEFYDYLTANLTAVQFFAFGRERGDGTAENPEGTEHYQGYIEFSAPKRFSTMLSWLSSENIGVNAHIEKRRGKKKDCFDYIMKQGKYEDKAHTRIGEVMSFGKLDFAEESSQSKDLKQIIELINEGTSLRDIIANFPLVYMRNYRNIEQYYEQAQVLKYEGKRRDIKVIYISGASGVGKTSYVMDKYGDDNVFKMTRYGSDTELEKFDGYRGQKVILFDEFRDSIPFSRMLDYLDIYYCPLPARNHDKVACYNTVYICSNWLLAKQYEFIQNTDKKSYAGWLRRIDEVYNFDLSKEKQVRKLDEFRLLNPETEKRPEQQTFVPVPDLIPVETKKLPFYDKGAQK